MITLTLLANAGILIQTPDTRLLVDGIQNEGNFPFSKTPASVLEEMLSPGAAGLYNNIDYLIFSHTHPDHFSPALTAEYVRCNKVRRLLLPSADKPGMQSLMHALADTNTPHWTFELVRGSVRQYRLAKDVSVTILCTRHMSQLFADDICSALLFSIAGKNILFLTDCSCKEEPLFRRIFDTPIDTVFINPYFYHDMDGRDILSKYIQPKQVVIYHIPFSGDDMIYIRNLVKQDSIKYPLEGLTLFQEPFQSLTLY